MLACSYGWDGVPGIIVVAPSFKFYDSADACKVIEQEVGMYTGGYVAHSAIGEKTAVDFARRNRPFVPFWI